MSRLSKRKFLQLTKELDDLTNELSEVMLSKSKHKKIGLSKLDLTHMLRNNIATITKTLREHEEAVERGDKEPIDTKAIERVLRDYKLIKARILNLNIDIEELKGKDEKEENRAEIEEIKEIIDSKIALMKSIDRELKQLTSDELEFVKLRYFEGEKLLDMEKILGKSNSSLQRWKTKILSKLEQLSLLDF